eukprot:767119-Hanusia_phi.AAC.3
MLLQGLFGNGVSDFGVFYWVCDQRVFLLSSLPADLRNDRLLSTNLNFSVLVLPCSGFGFNWIARWPSRRKRGTLSNQVF